MKIEVQTEDVPEGYVVLDSIVLMKVLNPDGKVVFREHYGEGLSIMERLGMLTSAASTMNHHINRNARPE